MLLGCSVDYYDTSWYKVLANFKFPSYSLTHALLVPTYFFSFRSYHMVGLGIKIWRCEEWVFNFFTGSVLSAQLVQVPCEEPWQLIATLLCQHHVQRNYYGHGASQYIQQRVACMQGGDNVWILTKATFQKQQFKASILQQACSQVTSGTKTTIYLPSFLRLFSLTNT